MILMVIRKYKTFIWRCWDDDDDDDGDYVDVCMYYLICVRFGFIFVKWVYIIVLFFECLWWLNDIVCKVFEIAFNKSFYSYYYDY